MVIPSVRPVHNWRKNKNKKGIYPIHLEIKIGVRKYFPIKVPYKVSKDEWSGKDDAWVKSTHPFFFEINNKIREKKSVIIELIKRYYTLNKSLSFDVVFKELNKRYNTGSFNQYLQDYINNPSDNIEPDTLKKYRACLEHLNNFNSDVKFHDLCPQLIEDFYQHCVKKAKLVGSTIDSYFDAFKKVVRLARKAHLIPKEEADELFGELHIDIKKSKRAFLSIEEIKQWKSLTFAPGEEHLARDRDIFLFQVYTGLYYKDVINLKKQYLVKDHEYGYFILGERDKNEEQNIIPVFRFPYANEIIDKYKSEDPLSEYVFDRKYILAEPVYNRNLKKLAPLAKIAKQISNKIARHSNAQLWIRLGAKKPIVQKMLGHADDKTTNAYFRVDMLEIIDGTGHVDLEKLGI